MKRPRRKISKAMEEEFEQRYLAEEAYRVEYETARRYFDEHIRPHSDESFDDYCNRQLLQQAQPAGTSH